MQHPLRIGTRGWRHKAWQGTFYDADLPQEWQLSWYANHLRSVWVPADRLHTISLDEIAVWIEDTDPDFRFIVELESASAYPETDPKQLSRVKAMAKALGHQLDAFVVDVKTGPIAEKGFLEQISSEISGVPVCLRGCPAQALPAGFGGCFDSCEDVASSDSPYTIVCQADGDLIGVRTVIETMQQLNTDSGALIFTDPERAFDHAVKARTVADLLDA